MSRIRRLLLAVLISGSLAAVAGVAATPALDASATTVLAKDSSRGPIGPPEHDENTMW